MNNNINPKVSIIIPTTAGLHLLKDTFHNLSINSSGLSFNTEIIIVDNGPDDGTKQWILNNGYKVNYVYIDKSIGFSKACNLGAKKSRGEFLFFINNDIKVNDDFLTPLIQLYEKNEKVFAIGPKFLKWDEISLDDAIRNPQFERGLVDAVLDEKNINKTMPMIFFLGGGFLVANKLFQELGGFDEIYTPFAWEDLDLGYRACKRGYFNIYCPDVTVYHKREATTKTKFSPVKFKSVVWCNKFIFMWTNFTDKKILKEHFGSLPFKLIKFLFNGRWPYVLGFLKALLKIAPIIKKRKKEKPYFVLNDQNMLDGTWQNTIKVKTF